MVYIYFLISNKNVLLKSVKVPQRYIGYIQEGHLTRKREVGKKIRMAKRNGGKGWEVIFKI
jgi:hypothetical protein